MANNTELKESDEGSEEKKEDGWAELGKTLLLAIILAFFVRTFFFEPFNIPSSSMKPTLLIGDYLFVSKTSYGYSRHSFPMSAAPIEGRMWNKIPNRGDIAVFKLPSNPGIDYIKRIIGLPGDRIQVRSGKLYINGKQVKRRALGNDTIKGLYGHEKTIMKYQETLPNGVTYQIYEEGHSMPLDDTPVFNVPEGHVFVMGDNRDNSQDSRVPELVGPVPFENLVGRATILFFSADGYKASILEFWKWPWAIRYDRIFQSLIPAKEPGMEA